jgi:hypothetical protein
LGRWLGTAAGRGVAACARRSARRRGLLLDLRRRQPVGLLLSRDGGVTAAVSPSPSRAAAGVGVASYWAATMSEKSGGGRSG